jgi:hypothetical protein
MHLDVRVPVGLMLVTMGVLLAGYGVLGDPAIYARSLGINVNAIWGGVLLAVGAVLLTLASRRLRGASGEAVGAGRK